MVRFRLILILLMCSSTNFSQVIEQYNFFWVSGGRGGFSELKIHELGGVSMNLGLNALNSRLIERRNSVRRANNLLKIRLAGYFNNGDEHSEAKYFDLGILYGKTTGNTLRFFTCAGVGLMSGTYNTIVYRPYPTTVGNGFVVINVPIEAGININSPVIGVGIAGFANINNSQPMLGIHLTLQVGRLTKMTNIRTKKDTEEDEKDIEDDVYF